jgi:low temperature requirement protein LtrA
VALGMNKTLGHVDEHLHLVPAFALLGGAAIYLHSHLAIRYRHIKTLNTRRIGCAAILFALLPVATELPALVTLAILAVLLIALIAIETHSYGASRNRIRHELDALPNPD